MVTARAWVATLRPYSRGGDCRECQGTGLGEPEGDDGTLYSTPCLQCLGCGVRVHCESCAEAVNMAEEHELTGDGYHAAFLATHAIEVQIDDQQRVTRLTCGRHECMGEALDRACAEAGKIAERQTLARAAVAACRHGDVPFACAACEADFEAKLMMRELAALERVRDRDIVDMPCGHRVKADPERSDWCSACEAAAEGEP